MEINLTCKNKFQSEKNLWVTYLTKVCGFKKISSRPEVLNSRFSVLSINPNHQQIRIDFSQFPQIKIKASNLFFSAEIKKKIVEVWFEDLEEQVFIWAKTDKALPFNGVSVLTQKSFNGVSELASRLIFPLIGLTIFNLIIYTILCYCLLKGIITEMQFDENAPPHFLSINQIKPTIIGLYQSDQELMKASFLCALLGGSWFLVAQQFLICCLLKFSNFCFKKVILSIFIFGIFEGIIYFDPRNYGWVLLFVPITFFSYFIFGFFSRNFALLVVKKPI